VMGVLKSWDGDSRQPIRLTKTRIIRLSARVDLLKKLNLTPS
jgi:hypothetical protein